MVLNSNEPQPIQDMLTDPPAVVEAAAAAAASAAVEGSTEQQINSSTAEQQQVNNGLDSAQPQAVELVAANNASPQASIQPDPMLATSDPVEAGEQQQQQQQQQQVYYDQLSSSSMAASYPILLYQLLPYGPPLLLDALLGTALQLLAA